MLGSVGRVGLSTRRASVAAAAIIQSVQADGWQAVWPSTPPTFDPNNSPVSQTFARQGFDTSGTATTVLENIIINRRVRQVFPNQTSDTAANVALADYVYSTDSAAGVTNNSTEISPKPIAAWVMRDRQLVGNTINWEIVAFHRNARSQQMVACVRVRGNDGTNQTAWQVVSTTVVSTYCEDANAVEVYAGTLDITALNTGLVWLEAEVMPWIGGAASVLKSEDSTVPREFSRRNFYKDMTREANPPLAYVSSSGVDATGVWSTNATTAAATPFLTVTGAMTAMNDATRGTPATGGIMDGCRIRIVNTVNLGGGSATTRSQSVAAVIVERAPGTARASAIVTWGATMRPRLGVGTLLGGLTEGALCFFDVTLNRTGAFNINGETTNNLQMHWHNVALSSSSATSFSTSSGPTHLYTFGTVVTGTCPAFQTTGTQRRLLRGLVCNLAGVTFEAFNTIGCTITGVNGVTIQDASAPFIGYSNQWLAPGSTSGVGAFVGTVSGGDLGGYAWVQNLVEVLHTTTSTAGWRVANDGALGNITHAVNCYNTHTGYRGVSRQNQFYDEATVARFHKLIRDVGNVYSQMNTKGDMFQSDGTRTGQFAYTHGVGCQGNWSQFRPSTATLGNENQTFPGIRSNMNTTSDTVRNDPLFVNYQATDGSGGTATAGAGGGNYRLQGGSPARGIVDQALLRFSLDGTARNATADVPGCYA